MKQHKYTFISIWHLEATTPEVWAHLVEIEAWPTWWKGVIHAKILERHEENYGLGSKIEMSWKSWLPYTINFVLTIIESDPVAQRLVAHSEGSGTWVFSEQAGIVTATYTWEVATTKKWMNFLAPLAKPLFKHAHDTVMKWGEEGLKKLLLQEKKS
jgi:hypothetical protein